MRDTEGEVVAERNGPFGKKGCDAAGKQHIEERKGEKETCSWYDYYVGNQEIRIELLEGGESDWEGGQGGRETDDGCLP